MFLEFPWDLECLPFVAFEDREMLPACAGVYFACADAAVLYIGGTVNLLNRLPYHNHLDLFLKHGATHITWMPLAFPPSKSKREKIRTIEGQCLDHWHPVLNIRLGKGTPLQDHHEDMPTYAHDYTLDVIHGENGGAVIWRAINSPARSRRDKSRDCPHTVFASSLWEAQRLAIAACQAHQEPHDADHHPHQGDPDAPV